MQHLLLSCGMLHIFDEETYGPLLAVRLGSGFSLSPLIIFIFLRELAEVISLKSCLGTMPAPDQQLGR